jgi:hypothetical protein
VRACQCIRIHKGNKRGGKSISLIFEITNTIPIDCAPCGLLARPAWLRRLFDLLVPGASKGSQLITPAGYATRHLRLSRVVVFVVFASRPACMMVVMKCVGSGRARVLVGTRAAKSVAFAPASPALAVAPRQSWTAMMSVVEVAWMQSAWLGLLDDFSGFVGVCKGYASQE